MEMLSERIEALQFLSDERNEFDTERFFGKCAEGFDREEAENFVKELLRCGARRVEAVDLIRNRDRTGKDLGGLRSMKLAVTLPTDPFGVMRVLLYCLEDAFQGVSGNTYVNGDPKSLDPILYIAWEE